MYKKKILLIVKDKKWFFHFLNYLDKIIMHLSVGNTNEKILVNLNIYKNLKIK